MEVKTINPILVDPTDSNVNGYLGNSVVNLDLKGKAQDVNVGDFVVKGTNPVFVGDTEASRNEFLYSEPVEFDGETLTPNDEFLYSNASGKDRRAQRRMLKIDKETYRKALKDEKGATVAEQEAKLEEGKFWNILKGGWESFKTSPSGQIIIDSAATNISNRLGGGSFSQPSGADVTPAPKTEDEPKPLSATTKYVLIGLGVLVVGAIIYSAVKKK